jgi:hypothetical protein
MPIADAALADGRCSTGLAVTIAAEDARAALVGIQVVFPEEEEEGLLP